MYWLGIDIGTGGSRALLVDRQGVVRAAFTAGHDDMTMERPLWAEQRPENWWDAAQLAIRGVLAQAGVKGDQILGIGLSGQMHGLTLLDSAGAVVRPALIWCDQRSQDQVDWINANVGAQNLLAWTANPVLTGFTLPKLLWVRDHEPANFARIRHLLLPKDYIRFQLTGEFATEVSDASGTSLFDVVGRQWSWPLVEKLGLDKGILPKVCESQEVTGAVSAAAAATGLKAGTPVVGGAGDQAASAVGNGIVETGIASCTLGTSGVVFAHQDSPAYDPQGRVHTFCHAVPGKWHVMGVTQGAGLSLQWFRNQLTPGLSYDELTAEAARSPIGAQGLVWLPYLMGERTPHLDAMARAAWVGLTAKHTRADMIRAVIEGVSYSQMDCLRIIDELGAGIRSVRLSGGGAKSEFWRTMLANIFARPVVTLGTQEGSAFGAALLAMTGTGAFASVAEACRATVKIVDERRPDPLPETATAYGKTYAAYRALYPRLKPIYSALSE
ncbi:MAG: xylulokinase [Acidobacteria bacterium]|nr:xylulokinase [Acidobacteriota bacterium]